MNHCQSLTGKAGVFFFISLLLVIIISSNAVASDCQIISSWEPWEPYQYQGENLKLRGLDIEIIATAFRNTQCRVSFIKMPWDQAVRSIKSGNIDITMSASKTPERETFAYFSEPYRSEQFVLYVRKDSSKHYKFSKLSDIINTRFKLGVVHGYYYGEDYAGMVKNPISKLNLQEVSNDETNFQKFSNNEIDGVLADTIVGAANIKKLGIADKIEIHPVKIHTSPVYIMFSKKTMSPDIVRKFNEALYKLHANGIYDLIISKYSNY